MAELELSQSSKDVVEKNIQILEEITNHAKEIHRLVGEVNYVFLMKDTIGLHLSELEAEVNKKLDMLILTRYRATRQGLPMQLQAVLGVLGGMERVEGAVRDDLYETLSSEHSMGRADVDKLIGVLMRDGIIFSPRPGYYKRTV